MNKIDQALYRAAQKIIRPEPDTPLSICSICRLDVCGHHVAKVGPFTICLCLNCPKIVP